MCTASSRRASPISRRLPIRSIGSSAPQNQARRAARPWRSGTDRAAPPSSSRHSVSDLAGRSDWREDLGEIHLELLYLAALAADLLDRLVAKSRDCGFALLQSLLRVPAGRREGPPGLAIDQQQRRPRAGLLADYRKDLVFEVRDTFGMLCRIALDGGHPDGHACLCRLDPLKHGDLVLVVVHDLPARLSPDRFRLGTDLRTCVLHRLFAFPVGHG